MREQKPKLRPLKDLPIFIEEDHHEVLPHIYKMIGAKHLPLEKNTLVHFDSHPDMLIPKDLSPEEAFDKFALFQKLSIENWIIPGAFVGVFSTIVWVCPPWSDQISPGEYDFYVGRDKRTDRIAVTCLESYYISEGLFTTKDNMDNLRMIKLIVIKLMEPESNSTVSREVHDQLEMVKEQIGEVDHFILDIDLDFFSTLNPFVSLYQEANLYDQLKQLYSFSPVPRNMEHGKRVELALSVGAERADKVRKLGLIWGHMMEEENLDMYEGEGQELTDIVTHIALSVKKHYPRQEVDWRMVHEAGQTFDDSELPHHVSTQAEIQTMLRLTEQFLDQLDKSPTIVTVSRSSQDDYCPPDQVEDIQLGVLSLLKIKYPRVEEHHCYREIE